MTPLVSVIVPVYKVEQYLDKCIESIVSQTYRNLEIILVDDGSPDSCPQTCDAWAEKDARIRVIHQENGGLSEARNAGMRIAAGEYLAFVDSDDYVTADFIERLLKLAVTTGSDIACSGIEKVWEADGTAKRQTGTFAGILDNGSAMRAILREDDLSVVVWNKLYRRETVNGLFFPKGKYHEDVFWSYRAVANANRVAVTPETGYYYVQRSGSIMGESYSLKRLDGVEAAAERSAFLEEHYPLLAAEGRVKLVFVCLYHGQKAITNLRGAERRQAIRFLKRTLREHPLHRGDTKGLRKSQTVWAAMARVSFVLTCRLRNLLKIGL